MGAWKTGPQGTYYDETAEDEDPAAPTVPKVTSPYTNAPTPNPYALPTSPYTNAPTADPYGTTAPSPYTNGPTPTDPYGGTAPSPYTNMTTNPYGTAPATAPMNAPSPGADVYADYANTVKQWYRDALGYEASDAEANQWAQNPVAMQGVNDWRAGHGEFRTAPPQFSPQGATDTSLRAMLLPRRGL